MKFQKYVVIFPVISKSTWLSQADHSWYTRLDLTNNSNLERTRMQHLLLKGDKTYYKMAHLKRAIVHKKVQALNFM